MTTETVSAEICSCQCHAPLNHPWETVLCGLCCYYCERCGQNIASGKWVQHKEHCPYEDMETGERS